jgi:hypothetical protein
MLERMWGKKGTFIHCWLEYKLVHPVWKTVWRLQKKNRLLYDPAIILRDIPKGM